MLPALDPDTGRLPFDRDVPNSVYRASLSEVAEMFVTIDGEVRHRRHLMDALVLWHSRFRRVCPGTRLWLSGSFLSTKARPRDVDVLVWVEDPLTYGRLFAPAKGRGYEYFTMKDVGVNLQPQGSFEGPYERLQPVAGLVDAHLARGWIPEHVGYWRSSWTREFNRSGDQTGVRMGVVEVVP